MRSLSDRMVYAVLLLMTMALFAPGCASDGSYSGSASVGVYGYGYYGGYPGYYGSNVVVGAPVHPGGVQPPGARPPQASQLPSRPMPAPAPRPMPRGGGGRR